MCKEAHSIVEDEQTTLVRVKDGSEGQMKLVQDYDTLMRV
jgi:hypothetical protein